MAVRVVRATMSDANLQKEIEHILSGLGFVGGRLNDIFGNDGGVKPEWIQAISAILMLEDSGDHSCIIASGHEVDAIIKRILNTHNIDQGGGR